MKKALTEIRIKSYESLELAQENARLTKLLMLRQITPPHIRRSVSARVIARSPSAWNKAFLIDQGSLQGLRANMLVLAESSLVGKVIVTGPSVSTVLLITDPNSKIGVLIQRTRQQGILFGTSSGGCRMKYISLEPEVKLGDMVETVGFRGLIPKGLVVGTVTRVWKEPGQIYQVAQIKPLTDLDRLEEVVCVE